MPNLLQKLTYFDPETSRQFVIGDKGFAWKQAVKSPEDSKVTRLVAQYGWELKYGTDTFLLFKRPKQKGELNVLRGTKQWFLDMGGPVYEDTPGGTGLKSLQRALEDNQMNISKAANPAATAVNNAAKGTPGLNRRPDYAEADSIVALDGGVKTGSTGLPATLYVTSADYKGITLEKFSFSPNIEKARIFPPLMAKSLSNQIKGRFGVTSHIILAYNYEEMFKSILALNPESKFLIDKEITWAKRSLKKQDRVIWFLRWIRLAIMQELYHAAGAAGSGRPAEPTSPGEKSREQIYKERVKNVLDQYKKDMSAKGGNPDADSMSIGDLSTIHANLDHFYGLNVPEINNYSPTVETWTDLRQRFSSIEQAWAEAAKRGLKPKTEDKVFIKFPDGWAWWFLPRSSCDQEAKAMGHCGNSPFAGREGIGILSLRRPVKHGKDFLWEPHLTFILHEDPPGADSGTLGEMKGKGNAKPTPQYHPYIMKLLEDHRIQGVGGGGYLASHNFSFSDLTPEQQAIVNKINPGVGMTIAGYYKEHGMDGKLLKKIKAILGLESATYDPKYGVAVASWPNEEEFIKKTGDSEAKKAWMFVQTGEHNYDSPDIDELTDLLNGINDPQIHNIGLSLTYDFPVEMQSWYSNFNPNDKVAVKLALTDLYNAYIAKGQKVFDQEVDKLKKYLTTQENEKNETGGFANPEVIQEIKEKLKGYDQNKVWDAVPVLQKLHAAYVAGGPNQAEVRANIKKKVQEGLKDKDRIKITTTTDGRYLQLMDEKKLVKDAQGHQDAGGTGGYYDTPEFRWSFPYDWDEWNPERTNKAVAKLFGEPSKKPSRNVKQKRLFPEPKTNEDAVRKGIAVSSFRNPLLQKRLIFE